MSKINKINKKVSRDVIIKDIYKILDSASDDEIIDIQKYVREKKSDKNTVKVSKNNKVDKDAKIIKNISIDETCDSDNTDLTNVHEPNTNIQKIEIIIKVLNNMLRAIGLDEINDLIYFKIRRDNLIDDRSIVSVENDYDTVFKSNLFSKKTTGWYSRKTAKHAHINFLKGIINSTNEYEFVPVICRAKNDKYTNYVIIKK